MANRSSVKPGIWQSAREINVWFVVFLSGCALAWIVIVLAVLDLFS